MSQQKLCLKWNNHTGNLLSVLQDFQKTEVSVDVTLSCESRSIKAHKLILSACSPYFKELFDGNPCQHPIIIINGMKFEDIKSILDFMYRGEVNVSHDGLSSFLQAAEALKVKGLAEVCGEKQIQEPQIIQHSEAGPSRTDASNRRRHRGRKRSLSDSNRSDDDSSKKHKEPNSPEIHELSADEFDGRDIVPSDGPIANSTPRVPTSTYSSRSHQSEDEYEVEPSKLLEQTLTTDNVPLTSQANSLIPSENNLRIERIMGNSSEMESSNMQEPESPPDIKPFVQLGDSGVGPQDSMLYNEQSEPGPSNFQDGSLMQDNSQPQEYSNYEGGSNSNLPGVPVEILPFLKQRPELSIFERKGPKASKAHTFRCSLCPFETGIQPHFQNHMAEHKANKDCPCPICGKIYKGESRLQVHMQAHETEPFVCIYCEKRFKTNMQYTAHMSQVHQCYECNVCKKQFQNKTALKKHMVLHVGNAYMK